MFGRKFTALSLRLQASLAAFPGDVNPHGRQKILKAGIPLEAVIVCIQQATNSSIRREKDAAID